MYIGIARKSLDSKVGVKRSVPVILASYVPYNDLSVDREDSLMSKRMVMRTEQPTKCLYHISYGG